MPNLALDYEGQVPFDSMEKAPFSVEVQDDGSMTGTAKPPGLRLKDYAMSDAKRARVAGKKRVEPPREPHRRGIIIERDGTYISGKDMRKRKEKRENQVLTLAKKYYSECKSEILEYMRSLDITKRATREQKEEPKKALRRALKIVKLGHPMTKAMAMEKARTFVEQQLKKRG